MAEVEPKQEDASDSSAEFKSDTHSKTDNYSSSQAQNGLTCNVAGDTSESSELSFCYTDSDRNKLPNVNCPEKIVSKK